ncbi:adenylate/guanylate cyclase domain-containing protein [Leptolyngbya sp. 'hensonii']|uniref:adenylate/guanylate cyclase domain-containing protein n=1 Tax=Leptolyngbya sp. 'hensonii' TaxID=1922337 RepID=UPI000ADD09FB|nr:adenylate/guanylate cyclase domain-containing protein [Leptolyngbya sp. 'hensonii']
MEAPLKTFFDLSPDLLCIRNQDGYFQDLNQSWVRVLGWSVEELRSTPWMEFVHTNDRAETDEMEVLCQAEPSLQSMVQYKNRYRCKDGSYRWLSWRLSPYQNGLSYGIAQDVSEKSWSGSQAYRAGIEEALKLRDQAIAASNAGIVIADARLPDMPLIYVNPAFERMTGYAISEVLGTNCRFLQGQDREQPEIDRLRFAIKGGEDCTVVLRNYRKDGTLFWNELHISPIYDNSGKLTHFVGVQTDISDRKRAENALQFEKEKSEQLLLNILPRSIAERLKQYQIGATTKHNGEAFIADGFEDVTVLFADLVGFTELASNISPKKLVGLLNQIFSVFDDLTEQYGLEKIKTIGDAYMVVGGLPDSRRDHAEAIADMALAMQHKIAQFSASHGQPFAIRVGINSGPVVAGVIGTKKFSYDLWGDTVNLASRMESQGQPGKIQVTAATYERLKAQYQFASRGSISIKGKGLVNTYWLTGKTP